MTLRLIVTPRKCTGCRSCELACAFTHGEGGQPGTSRCATLTVASTEFVPMLCLQCDHAACIDVCPVGAVTRDASTEVVHVDEARCIRCFACTVACPFGNMHLDRDASAVLTCDLCAGHGGDPRCARFCPTGALTTVRA